MIKTANKNAREYVENLIEFQGSNTFSKKKGEYYIVYSYGTHWILYLYTGRDWYACDEKRSSSTSKHLSQLRPGATIKEYLNQSQLQQLIYGT